MYRACRSINNKHLFYWTHCSFLKMELAVAALSLEFPVCSPRIWNTWNWLFNDLPWTLDKYVFWPPYTLSNTINRRINCPFRADLSPRNKSKSRRIFRTREPEDSQVLVHAAFIPSFEDSSFFVTLEGRPMTSTLKAWRFTHNQWPYEDKLRWIASSKHRSNRAKRLSPRGIIHDSLFSVGLSRPDKCYREPAGMAVNSLWAIHLTRSQETRVND